MKFKATQIGNGSVDDTEFQALNGVEGNIQNQIDNIIPSGGTAGQILVSDGAGGMIWADQETGVDIGDFKHSFAEEAPPKWLPCDGAILLQSVYPDLYAALEPGFPAVVTGELTFDLLSANRSRPRNLYLDRSRIK